MTTKITTDNIASETLTTILGPKVSSIVYPGNDTATNTAGGDSITLLGSGFNSGASVIINGTSASVVTVVSSTQITFTAPAQTAGTYVIYVINSDGGTAISIPGISYSGTPNWSTSAGSVGTVYETGSISTTVTATGDAPITYSVVSGTLPTGSTLDTSSGLISGTASATASSTTYSFTIKASDAQNQDTNRAFTITVNPDVVTWSTPTNNETYNVSKDIAIANVAMSATSASGGSITYTADTLPTGLSITGANIAGTPTVAASTSTTLTATSTSTRSATRTINWVISVANDTYFKNTTLLLNGETTVTPFISDASANSFGLTIVGDTKPVLFNPYRGDGYYSAYFDGTGDTLSISSPTTGLSFGTGEFTIEMWVYKPSVGTGALLDARSSAAATPWFFGIDGSNFPYFYDGTSYTSSVAVTINSWSHVSVVRTSGVLKIFVNGVQGYSASYATNLDRTAGLVIGDTVHAAAPLLAYISNLRIVKGTAVYTSAFTPPTTPLTAIANTSLLTCQSNRFIDNSTNNFTITKNGDTSVSPAIPFTANSSYSTYGSAYFDGTGDYLTAPSNVALNLTGDFTIEFWAYPTASIASKSIAGTTTSSMHFDSGGYFYLLNSVSQYLRATDASFLTLNTWTHVSISRSGSTLKFFKNGIDNGVAENVGSASTATFTFSGLNIGYSPHVNAGAYLTGYISNFRIVKGTAVYTSNFVPPTQPLTAIANTSLLTLQYNGGANNYGIIDNSNFNNIITRNGNPSQGTFSPYSVTGWSNYFSGSTDYLTLPSSSTAYNFGVNVDFTIEAWVYPTVLQGFSWGIIDARVNGATAAAWLLQLVPSSGTYRLEFYNAAANTGTTSIPLNTWTHVAASRVGSNLYLYVNGTLDRTITSYNGAISPGTTAPRVGTSKDASGTNYATTGYISNLRIVNGTGLYSSNFTPSTTPLTAIANTSLLTCQSNRFVDNSPNSFALTISGTPSVQAFDPFGSIPEAVPISYSNYFDGTGDYLTVANNIALQLGSTYTVEVWCYLNSYSSNDRIISDGSTNAADLDLGVGSDGRVFYAGAIVYVGESYILPLSTWTHIAVVVNAGTLSIYINGVSKTLIGTTTGYNHTNSGTKYIGAYQGSSLFWRGYISNLRLVKGTAVYTSTFTPSTTPLTAIANTSLLTCQSTRMIDNSTNNFTITASGDTKPRIFNPFGYTAQSATSYTPSLHGGSIYFDGTGDYLTVPNSKVWDQTIPYTVEMWIYPTSANANQYLYSQLSNPYNGIVWTGSGFNVDKSYVGAFITGSGSYSIYQWIHVAMTYDGTTTRLFANGTLIGSAAGTGGASGAALYIANYQNAGTYTYYGYMSDLRVTPGKALYTSNFYPDSAPATTTTTIGASTYSSALLLNGTSGGIVDQHGTNVLETVGNAQLSTAVKKYNNGSIYFDGTGDGLLAPSSANFDFGTGNFTIEMWINFTNVTSDWQAVISRAYTIAGGWRLYKDSGTNQLRWYAGGSNLVLTTGSTLANNTWGHVAVVRNNGTITVYIDGVNRGSAADSTNYNPGTYAVEIGQGVVTSAYPVTGYIDDLRITKGYARYTSNFTAPTSALITK